MDNLKEILIVIGNGFDLAYGLKTSFKDFYKSKFWPIDHKDKSRLSGGGLSSFLEMKMPNNWYDLESLLRQYARVYEKDLEKDRQKVDIHLYDHKSNNPILNDVSPRVSYSPAFPSLARFIKKDNEYAQLYEKQHLKKDKKLFFEIKQGLNAFILDRISKATKPDPDNPAVRFLNTIQKCRKPIIYSFNYTNLNYLAELAGVKKLSFSHVHGSVVGPENIVLGISDEFDVRDGYYFLKKVSEPTYKSNNLYYDLMKAREIVFFGHSLGENDFHFFRQFFKLHSDESIIDQSNKCLITIITADTDSRMNILSNLRKMNNGKNNQLFAQNNLNFIRIAEPNDPLANVLFDQWLDYLLFTL